MAEPQANAERSEKKPEYKERQPQWTAMRHQRERAKHRLQ